MTGNDLSTGTARSLTLLLVGTTACNLSCSYCYVGDARLGHIDVAQFKQIYSKIDGYFDSAIDFNIVFHGGEPLLLGLDFYREVFEFLREQDRKCSTAIQTNLTLLTPEFIELFKEKKCQIGTSIDGTLQMHDKYRVHKDGRGSYSEVLKKIQEVNDMESSCGVIATLTKENIANPQILYESFRSYDAAAVFFSFVYLADDTANAMPKPGEMGKALINLFDIWLTDSGPVNLPYFAEVIRGLLGISRDQSCRFAPDCTEYFLAVDPQGFVYPCCDFVTQPNFRYGNIFTDNFSDIWNSSTRQVLSQREKNLLQSSCSQCEFQPLCHGGCMAKTTNPPHEPDYYCADYKIFFSHVKNVLDDLP